MVRVLHVVSISAMVAACGVSALWLSERNWDDPYRDEIRNGPHPVHMFSAEAARLEMCEVDVSPLVVQAEAFQRILVPPKPPEDAPVLFFPKASPVSVAPPVRPSLPSARFRLHGTSCCPNRPERSMALISELGSLEGSERWVKEGAQVGHFVIHEIRPDGIVYRDGDQLREMAVEVTAGPTRLVQDIRPGSRRVIAAVEDVGIVGTTPAGPNSIEITGN